MANRKQDLKSLIRLFGGVDREHRSIIESKVEELGVHRTQHMMLMFISVHEGAAQKEIARAFDVSPSAVAVSTKKLETQGLIERIKKEGDVRTNSLTLTPKGKQMVEQSKELFSAVDEAMFKGFSDDEIGMLTGFLLRARENLSIYAIAQNGGLSPVSFLPTTKNGGLSPVATPADSTQNGGLSPVSLNEEEQL